MVKEDVEQMQKRIMESKFDFNDFLSQTRNLARMGSMSNVMKFIPGMNKVLLLLLCIYHDVNTLKPECCIGPFLGIFTSLGSTFV